jgi:hypothetical protein
MSSFDKVVKLACKPKAAAPKDKVRASSLYLVFVADGSVQYLDPIIAATWSDDGAVHDVCKALVSRIREPNAIVCRSNPFLFFYLMCLVIYRSYSKP